MRAMSVLGVSLLVVLASVVGLTAQDKASAPPVSVAGNWAGDIKTAVSYSPIVITFSFGQKPEGVTGFAWPGKGQVPITNVKRDGGKLAFDVSGDNVTYHFTLTVGAERLEGDVSANDHGHTWTGKAILDRAKPKDTGKK